MSLTRITLGEAYEAIIEEISSILSDAATEGGHLDGVETVTYGRSHRGQPKFPALWVIGGTATAANERALHETWTLQVGLIAICKGTTDLDLLSVQAGKYAANARSVLLENRRLLTTKLPYVRTVNSLRFDPHAEREEDRALVAAEATVAVEFTILDRLDEQ